jgi:hypothetical protein
MVTSTSSVSSAVEIRWGRALGVLLAGLLAVLAVSAAGYATAAVLSQTTDAGGTVCGSAWRFHTGTGTRVPAGDMTPAQRAAVSEQCARSGDADWDRGVRWGWVALAAALAAVVLALFTRTGARPQAVSGRGARPAPTAGPRHG